MHVGFEAKRFFTNFTGLGNYARFVVSALSEVRSTDQFTLYSPRVVSHPDVDEIVSRQNVHVVVPRGVYKYFKGLWRSWAVVGEPSLPLLDVFHGLSQEIPFGLPRRVKKVVTVHDLIYLRFPQFYHPIDVAIYKAKAVSACRRADAVVAISQQTADDLVQFLRVDPRKIHVVYQGCHPIFQRQASAEAVAAVRQRYNLPAQFLLTVGTLEARKNVKQLVTAMSMLPQALQLPLVMVGRATAYKEEVLAEAASRGVTDKLIFLHHAAFKDFPALYRAATVFVYPSLFEGFGIPLVEAIASGVPVITSTGSCFREAAGPAARYADPHNAEALSQELVHVLEDASLRGTMVRESLQYIRQFEPAVIAANLVKVYAA